MFSRWQVANADMRVLVTGSTGFVGRVVCRSALEAGFTVREAVRRSNHVATNIVVGDIGPETNWAEALNGADTVVHLAARVHVMQDATADPLTEFRKVNVAGTERLARAAAAAGVQRFVFVSSIKVNGEQTPVLRPSKIASARIPLNPPFSKGGMRVGVFSERDAPNPQDPYGVSKWEAEQALHRISQETGMEVVIIRPPLVYGPGVGANFLRLLRFVQKGVPLPFGAIKNQRSLIYVGNLADAIVTCLKHPAAGGQTYLVSDGEDVSTPGLIRHIAHALGRPVRLLPVPLAVLRFAGHITGKSPEVERLLDSLVIDSAKIRRELGWKPPFTMGEGFRETAGWYLRTWVDT